MSPRLGYRYAGAVLRRALRVTLVLVVFAVALLTAGYFLVGAAGHGPVELRDLRTLYWFYVRRNGVAALVMEATPVLFAPFLLAFGARLRQPRAGGPQRLQLCTGLGLAVGGTWVLTRVAQTVFARPHPPRSFSAIAVAGYSFPSLSVALAATVCVAITAMVELRGVRPFAARLGCAAASVAFAASRVGLRAVWLTDAAVGLLVGAAWGLVAVALVAHFDLRRQVARPPAVWMRRRRHRIIGMAVLAVAVIAASPVERSYEQALTFPGSASWQLRSVDWFRSNHGSGIVDWVEGFWYERSPVADGGRMPVLRNPFGDAVESAGGASAGGPPPILAPIHPRLRHEALWAPAPVRRYGHPVVFTAQWRPDPRHSTVAVAALWVDHTLTRAQLVAGTRQPQGTWPWHAQIPVTMRATVVAAFNGGFRLADNVGGFMVNGRVGRPLVVGRASLVIHATGRVDVVAWTPTMARDRSIVAVRQNLDLIIDHNRPEPGIGRNTDSRRWDNRFLQGEWTWRSGVGVDRHGDLVYVAGPKLDLARLTLAMTEAGIVRGMELDMHPGVVTCNLYVPTTGARPGLIARKLIASMTRPATRYLQPDQRDFIAIAVRGDER